MPTQPIPSLRAQRDLRKLGQDIAIARKRRQFTQKRLAEGASVNVATIRRLENGDQGVSLGTLAMVLLVLGESQRIADLLDVARDDVGLSLSVTAMPKRVRGPNRKQQKKATAKKAPPLKVMQFLRGFDCDTAYFAGLHRRCGYRGWHSSVYCGSRARALQFPVCPKLA